MTTIVIQPVTFEDLIFTDHPVYKDKGVRASHIFGHNGYSVSVIKTPKTGDHYEIGVIHAGNLKYIIDRLDEISVTNVLALVSSLPEQQEQ